MIMILNIQHFITSLVTGSHNKHKAETTNTVMCIKSLNKCMYSHFTIQFNNENKSITYNLFYFKFMMSKQGLF